MAKSDDQDEDAYPDWLMLAAFQEYKHGEISEATCMNSNSCVDDDDLCKVVSKSVPKKTCEHTKWCFDTWSKWCLHCISKAKADSEKPPIHDHSMNS